MGKGRDILAGKKPAVEALGGARVGEHPRWSRCQGPGARRSLLYLRTSKKVPI